MLLTLLPYLTVAANLALVLVILLGLNQRVQQLRDRAGKQEKALQAETLRMSTEITGLKNQILELEQTSQSLTAVAAPGSTSPAGQGVSHTLRSKVLKLHRLGQSPDRIAGAL